MEDKYIKLRELRGLQGSVLALKNQMIDTIKELNRVMELEYEYNESTDEEKKVMDDIEIMVEEINEMWG